MKNNKKTVSLYFLFAALFVLFFLANRINSIFGLVAFGITIVFTIFSKENYFYALFFLLPCVRILDCVGVTFLVNILYAFIAFKFVITNNPKQLPILLLISFGLFVFEFLHANFDSISSISSSCFNAFNMAFDLCALLVIVTSSKNYDSYILPKALLLGVICSSLCRILIDPSQISQFVNSWQRFSAFGNDPNYLSSYIIVGIAGIIVSPFSDTNYHLKHHLSDVLLIFASIAFGLLTASKMFIICVAIIFITFLVMMFLTGHTKVALISIFSIISIAVIVIIFANNAVSGIIEKITGRFSNATDINSLTTGRFEIVEYYSRTVIRNPVSLLFGRGVNYTDYYSIPGETILVAHNTFLDVLLSWGIIGSFFVIASSIYYLKSVAFRRQKRMVVFLPFAMYMLVLFSLSCLSADMFWYLLALCILTFKKTSVSVFKRSMVYQKTIARSFKYESFGHSC